MKYCRTALSLLVAAGAVVTVNCGDYDAAAPQTPASEPVVAAGIGTLLNGLLNCSRLPALSQSRAIGPNGGVIALGPHMIRIPRNALPTTVMITASLMSENVARVRLEPHGLQFALPVTLTMSYRHCGLAATFRPMRIAYVSSGLDVFDHLPSIPDVFNKTTTAFLWHFSDYAVEEYSFSDHVIAWGPGTVAR